MRSASDFLKNGLTAISFHDLIQFIRVKTYVLKGTLFFKGSVAGWLRRLTVDGRAATH